MKKFNSTLLLAVVCTGLILAGCQKPAAQPAAPETAPATQGATGSISITEAPTTQGATGSMSITEAPVVKADKAAKDAAPATTKGN